MWDRYFQSIKAVLACIFSLEGRNALKDKIKKINKPRVKTQRFLSNLYGVKSHCFACWLHKVLSSTLTTLFRYWRQLKKTIPYRPYWWQFLTANSNFLLVIRPKPWQIFKNKSSASLDFPPPGYGIPAGYKKLGSSDNYEPVREYGLYLFPGKLLRWFILFALILPFVLFSPLKGGDIPYFLMIFVYLVLSFLIYYFLFKKLIPASLSNVWRKWPISAYELFLSVPHSIYISHCDRYQKKGTEKGVNQYKKIKEYIFWRPDVKSPLWRQSTEHSPNMQSLQELILNLALFELLFHKKNTVEKNKKVKKKRYDDFTSLKTLHEMRWYVYLFSPIWINLVLILFSIGFFALLKTNDSPSESIVENILGLSSPDSWHIIANFPYNFIFAVSAWYIFTVFYSVYIINYLSELSEKISDGLFDNNLHLIPQQILNELSYIPSHNEIEAAMHHLRKILSWISSVVFIGLMAILEVLSQAFGDNKVTFSF